MATCKAHARWEGSIKDGKGQVDAATFARHAEVAKAGCPVSQALAGTTITLDAKLVR